MLKFLSGMMMLGLVSCSSTKSVDSVPKLDFKIEKKELKNGLKIIAIENKKLPVFSFRTYYEVGGKHEPEGITGASHFLEHMMFKGAKKYKAGEFDKLIEGNGGNNNAYTSNDLTVYYENLPKEHLATVVDIEADRMQNLTLDPKAFESEREVVLEERKMRYENSDKGKLYLEMMLKMFEGTIYGTSVIGSIKDLKSMTRDQIYTYFKKYYSPNNAVIVVAGDFDAKDTVELIEKSFGQIPRYENLEDEKQQAYKIKTMNFKKSGFKDLTLKGVSPNPEFMLSFPGEKMGSQQGFVMDILSSILGDGASSYLSQEYVIGKNPKLSNVYAWNYTLQEAGVFTVGGQLLPNVSIDDFKKNLRDVLQNKCDVAITEKSVQKVKNQYLTGMLMGLDNNSSITSFFGNREVYLGDYMAYQDEMETYQSISVDQLRQTCKKYLSPDRSIFTSIWNKH